MGLFDNIKGMINEQMGINSPTSAESTQKKDEPAQQTSDNGDGVYNPQLEKLIALALADGELTEKEKQVLFKKAQAMGVELDEFEMVLDARLYQRTQAQNTQQAQQSPVSSAPKSDKYGDVKKCPSCGAMITSFTSACPDCGYEFSNIAANSSIQKLFEMLNQVETESRDDAKTLLGGIGRAYGDIFSKGFGGGSKDTRKKKTIIQNFPIPTTKDDILEFLTLAVPLARKPSIFNSDPVAMDMCRVWKTKCEQIIMKAKFSMRDDKKTLEMIAEYAKELKIKM